MIARCSIAWLAVSLFQAHSLLAQVGDVSDVNYPGWIPADRVDPTIGVSTEYNSTGPDWVYNYTVANGIGAEQDIIALDLRLNETPSDPQDVDVTPPDGWWGAAYPPPSAIPGVAFAGNRSQDPPGAVWSPSPDQIPAGSSLEGFVVRSSYPPGYARRYVQGYAALPHLYEEMDVDFNVPHDTTNSQRGWTLGPTKYTVVVTGGNRRPATDGFLGFMNLAEKGSLLTDPAPIAVEFSLNGETVMVETLEVKLNGVDVTDAFHPGPADGADLVGVFHLGSSPLEEGKNVLLTKVDGVIPSSGHTGTDADRIVFWVDPSLASGDRATDGLLNLPYPEPGFESLE